MVGLMQIKRDEKVLDYGCGTGWMIARMIHETGCNIIGYDINIADYMNELLYPQKFCNTLPEQQFDHIYMMHSLAHIENVGKALTELKTYMHDQSKVHVLTPNALWLKQLEDEDYKPDTTVVNHYTPNGLFSLFKSYGYTVVNQGSIGEDINGYHERLFITCTN